MSDPIHVFDQNPADAAELASEAIAPSVEVSADAAEAIAAVAESSGQSVHYHPEEGGDRYTYTAIRSD